MAKKKVFRWIESPLEIQPRSSSMAAELKKRY
jgi:hypothetical protein